MVVKVCFLSSNVNVICRLRANLSFSTIYNNGAIRPCVLEKNIIRKFYKKLMEIVIIKSTRAIQYTKLDFSKILFYENHNNSL